MVRSVSKTVSRWRERLLRFPQAGLTIEEFCRNEGISTASFYAWRKKLRDQPTAESFPRQSTPATPAFQPLQLIATPTATLTVQFPCGIRIELPADQTQAIRTVMTELLRAELLRAESPRGEA